MKIGVISDTHDYIENIEKSVQLFNDRKVSIVMLAGDYVNPKAVRAFKGVKLIGVLGNNDVDKSGLADAFNDIEGDLRGELCELDKEDLKFAIYHGTQSERKNSLIRSQKYDVVVYGHTHKIQNTTVGKTLVLNPGTAKGWFFGYNATMAIFDTQTRIIEFINI
jgi:putative phosphoesterase